jgi:hypothetical protein
VEWGCRRVLEWGESSYSAGGEVDPTLCPVSPTTTPHPSYLGTSASYALGPHRRRQPHRPLPDPMIPSRTCQHPPMHRRGESVPRRTNLCAQRSVVGSRGWEPARQDNLTRDRMATCFEKTKARSDDHGLYGKVEGDSDNGDGPLCTVNRPSVSAWTGNENLRMDK